MERDFGEREFGEREFEERERMRESGDFVGRREKTECTGL